MPSLDSKWPTLSEYDWALQNRRTTFSDPDIQRGQLREVGGRPARLNGGGSKYVCVYQVGNWVVRCFTVRPPNAVPPADIEVRYRVITGYFNRFGASPELAFLVPHIWVERGLNVKGDDLPFLKVPYIAEGQQLGAFLSDNYRDQRSMKVLVQQWFEVVRQLEAKQIAHGDLDLTNILVCGTPPNLSLKLIDFDGMYVPDLASYGLAVADKGHEHFQPAEAKIRTFGPDMDRFSALIIYLTLSALSRNYALWENCGADETRSLLGAEDFARLGLSKRYARLRQEQGNQELQQCLQELQDSIVAGRMPRNLMEILNRRGPAPSDSYMERPSSPLTTTYDGRALSIPLEPSQAPLDMPPPPPPPPYIPPSYTPPPYPPQPNPYAGYPMPVPQAERGRGQAVAGLVLGIISLVAWLIPLIGAPVSIVGIILAALGRRSLSRRTMAGWGLALSILGLLLTIIFYAYSFSLIYNSLQTTP